ncbi:MAG TPA: tetratricopeptide repeat protein [Pyrinomonadaceae bacterium]|nr:tetratricopeptide repeat protein [Pyrinomonadaceae bacterium]
MNRQAMGKLSRYFVNLCLVVMLSFSAVFAQDKTDPAAEATARLLLQAQKLLEGAKADEAIKLLRSTDNAVSNEPEIAYLLGIAYHLKRDYVQAVQHLSAALKQIPKKDAKYRNAIQILGLSHYVLGHPKDAIPYLEETSLLLPDSTEIAYALGSCYIQTRDRDKSRAVFARMFKVPGSSAAAYLVNAQMMMRQRFEVLAEQELQKALALDPKLPQINFLLAEIAIFNAQIDRGIALLQKEIEINPTFAMAFYWLGEAYTRKLSWDEAVGPLQKSIWLNPHFSGPYIVLGKVYLKKGDLQNAEAMLRRATQMDPNNFSAHHLLAQVLQRANRAEEAKREFETAEKLRTASDKQP